MERIEDDGSELQREGREKMQSEDSLNPVTVRGNALGHAGTVGGWGRGVVSLEGSLYFCDLTPQSLPFLIN